MSAVAKTCGILRRRRRGNKGLPTKWNRCLTTRFCFSRLFIVQNAEWTNGFVAGLYTVLATALTVPSMNFFVYITVETKHLMVYSINVQELTEKRVLEIMTGYGNDPQQLIAILLDIQAASNRNYVEQRWAELAASVLNISLSKIYDILTFYAMFSTKERGEFVIEICKSAPCHFTNVEEVERWFEEAAGIYIGETTKDGRLSLIRTSCIGACDIGPAVKIGENVFGNLTEDKVRTLVRCCMEGKTKELESLCQN